MSKDGGVQEYDWDSRLVWEYSPSPNYLGPHHDVFRKANGNTLLICREAVPEEYMKEVIDPKFRTITIYGDAILEVAPDNKIVWKWHGYEHLI